MDCKSFEQSKLKWLKAEAESAKKKLEDAKKRTQNKGVLDFYKNECNIALARFEGYKMGAGL